MKFIVFLWIIISSTLAPAQNSSKIQCQVGKAQFLIEWKNTQKLALIETKNSRGTEAQIFGLKEELILTLTDEGVVTYRNLSPEGSIYKEQIVEFSKFDGIWSQIYYAYTLQSDSLEYIYEYPLEAAKDCVSLVEGKSVQTILRDQLGN